MLDLGEKTELLRKKGLVVVIPYPSSLPRARGVMARNNGKKTAGHTYYTPVEFEVVRKAAAAINLGYSEFTRWCSLKVAEQILKDMEDAEVPSQLDLPFGQGS